jgi:hypothetical protein
VLVTGLPSSASWQDLKVCIKHFFHCAVLSLCAALIYAFITFIFDLVQDHMRKAGDVCFSEVYREGGGKLYCESQLLHSA